ncbi:uncharacterized protein LOC125235633 [Leguminivora glycinivorella]|uniref:uncharacterized protein LOC125235633 n=1 Tax=Leguminivora glycinivorella TaxID=1035111 RepID=UPI0020103226|nr:uncharacterized protein LOC125235633 [Leguminivora glycinivorella]
MEAPEFKRCCFCLPLRRGLIAWGYVKVTLNMFMLAFAGLMFYILASYNSSSYNSDVAIFSIICICLPIDIAFTIVLIVAGHKKSIKLLKISYEYNTVWLGMLTLVTCFMLYLDIGFVQRLWPYIEDRKYLILEFFTGSAFGICFIFVQIYVILLIRSELKKLQNQTLEMQFTNHVSSGEPLCTLHNQCTDKKTVQDGCTDEKYENSNVYRNSLNIYNHDHVSQGLNILVLTQAAIILYFLICYAYSGRTFYADIVIFIIISICLLIDISFNIVFIVAGHKKNIKLMKLSYIYNIVVLGLMTLGACFVLYLDIDFIRRVWIYFEDRKYVITDLLTGSILWISLLFVQIYVILLTRSEMKKLESQTLEIQFTNRTTSGQPLCTLHNVENLCTDEKQVVQDVCTDGK